MIESAGGIEFEPVFASFGARAGGLAIDALVLMLLTLPGGIALASGSGGLIALGSLLVVAGFALGTILYARAVSSTGQSVGNRAAGTRVVDARNGSLVPAGVAGLRYVIRFLVSPIFFFGFVMAFFNTQRRTFHDNVAGTVVTRPPRATWSIDDENDVSP